MKKDKKGFTLVEVIVVAVIVAILAAVAVPLYLNYITSSRTNAAMNAGGSIASFCGACVNASGTLTVTPVATGGGTYSCASTSMGNTSGTIPEAIIVSVANNTITATHKDGGTSVNFTY